jgi:SAM-dependent methyltransferase
VTDPAVAWASPPVDDVGYVSSATLLELREEDLFELVVDFENTRYQGWRNWNGNWRRVLKMDSTTGKDVMDAGCGVGIEGLQYARAGNRVLPSDIVPENVELAIRVLTLMGFPVEPIYPPFDIIHSAGCLHHIPDPIAAVDSWASLLKPKGELRLMLYSDRAWMKHVGDDPPENTSEHPSFREYVAAMDAVGDYADWYDADKLERWFGEWFRLENFEYLTQDMSYCGAVMVKR